MMQYIIVRLIKFTFIIFLHIEAYLLVRLKETNKSSISLPDTSASTPLHRRIALGGYTDKQIVSFDDLIQEGAGYDIYGKDLFVLLHIQKTGGTSFEKHLVHDLKVPNPCSCNNERRRCFCPRSIAKNRSSIEPAIHRTLADYTWLASRFSIGWACGLHPDFIQLTRCLASLKRLFFLTFLRHPLSRFISEYRHVRRGATWKASRGHCKEHNTQLCYKNKTHWIDVSLDEFIECPTNMAVNRQTRMLASFNDLICKQSQVDDNILLASAMSNLNKISFFGICEQQRASQILFEKTFNMIFLENFTQSNDNETKALIATLPAKTIQRILELNILDIKLYNYAIDLFAYRCNQLTNTDDCGAKTLQIRY